jgi:hypothetical protein
MEETHETLGTFIGFDRHLQEQSNNEKSAQSMKENSEYIPYEFWKRAWTTCGCLTPDIALLYCI